jgi:peptidoglycan/LPS O-acetylase OafA/YrhL
MASTYLPGLNLLRIYAAVSVVVYHVMTQFPHIRRQPWTADWLERFWLDGHSAVNLFFVLSGFLITYLLLLEKREQGAINVRHFYARRILRIWPLYYLGLLVGLAVIPALGLAPGFWIDPWKRIAMVFMLPNLAAISWLGHFWSLGVEEQFYALWPWLVRRRRILWLMLAVILLKVVLTPVVAAVADRYWNNVFLYWRIESMAVGGLLAYVLVQRRSLLPLFFRMGPLALVLFGAMIVFSPRGVVLYSTTYGLAQALIFGIVILNAAANPRSPLHFDTPVTRQLGDLSFSIYVWHFPIQWCVMIMMHLGNWGAHYSGALLVAVFVLTFAAAGISRRYVEKPFLRLRHRFAPGRTRRNAARADAPRYDSLTVETR